MQILLNTISSVYSGIDGKCCCGCAGKHTYASAHRKWGSENRGYKVEDDEVNDRVVKQVVDKIEKAIAAGAPSRLDGSSNVSATVGRRLYIAYFKN